MNPGILREVLYSRIIKEARSLHIYDTSGHIGTFILSLGVLLGSVICVYYDIVNAYIFSVGVAIFIVVNIFAILHLRDATKIASMEYILENFEKHNNKIITNNGYVEQPLIKLEPVEVKELPQNETD